jgi:hypothetical protein
MTNDSWWRRLARPSGATLPPSVVQRVGWYETRVSRGRRSTYAMEAGIIVVSAAIPAAAAVGASAAFAGVLGAAVTALVGLRQLLRFNANWSRFSATLTAMQREVVTWSVASEPYGSDDADASIRLATAIEALVVAETAQWTDLRATTEQSLAGG